jgi:hypothetical protein
MTKRLVLLLEPTQAKMQSKTLLFLPLFQLQRRQPQFQPQRQHQLNKVQQQRHQLKETEQGIRTG